MVRVRRVVSYSASSVPGRNTIGTHRQIHGETRLCLRNLGLRHVQNNVALCSRYPGFTCLERSAWCCQTYVERRSSARAATWRLRPIVGTRHNNVPPSCRNASCSAFLPHYAPFRCGIFAYVIVLPSLLDCLLVYDAVHPHSTDMGKHRRTLQDRRNVFR
jgi:hypothetical protein